jgi:hypothetical protein
MNDNNVFEELVAVKNELAALRVAVESIAAAVVPVGPRNDDGSF